MERILHVELDWIYQTGEEGEKRIAERRAHLDAAGIEYPPGHDLKSLSLILNEKQYVDLVLTGERSMTLKSATLHEQDRFGRTVDRLEHLAQKLESFGTLEGLGQFNEKVEVYTPGMGLMLFNRVMLLEDACSDALQTELDNGWKIIAACPQPNQRRPDYILGRYDPKHADESGASTSALRGTPTPVRRTYETPPSDTADFL